MKKILIIGSMGYLGSRLVDYLSERGYFCDGVDIGFFQFGVLEYPKRLINIICDDARNLSEADIAPYDVVIQLAGISNDPFGNLNPEKIYDPTRNYAIEIAKKCKKLGVQYIFPSSCSVYGIGGSKLDETNEVNPQTPYSLNKVQIEGDLSELADVNFSPIALRLATVFGCSPRMRFDLVINMLCGMAIAERRVVLNSNGQAWRPHVHIDDVCEAFLQSIELDYQEGKLLVLNVGRDDNNLRILDIANLIKDSVSGCELKFLSSDNNAQDQDDLIKDRKIQDGVDARTYQVSFCKIQRVIPEYKARISVQEGIVRLLEELSRLHIDLNKFRQRDFYRLQQIEYLHKTFQISNELKFR